MELTLHEILILAVVQGITEFLPISSSGHLVVLATFLSPERGSAAFDIADLNIVLHGGTLGSILIFYGKRIWQLLTTDRRVLGLLVIGTVPAVGVGIPIKLFASDTILSNPLLAGVCLIITGGLLAWIGRMPRGEQPYQQLTYRAALGIGLSQAAAIMPGLSRSGTTISIGMRLGLAPTAAATFSFLLAIPAIGGACVLEIGSAWLKNRPTSPALSHAPLKNQHLTDSSQLAPAGLSPSATSPSATSTAASPLNAASSPPFPLSFSGEPSAKGAAEPTPEPASLGKHPFQGEQALTLDAPPLPLPVPRIPRWQLALGAVISCVVGLGSLAWLQRWIERNQIGNFAYWCIPLGLSVITWQLLGG
jgi:undecaprenyl-diphosphatase